MTTEDTIEMDNPTNPYGSLNTAIKPNREPILTIAEYPILVDSLACSFALITAEIVKGTRERDII